VPGVQEHETEQRAAAMSRRRRRRRRPSVPIEFPCRYIE
jgi:hypothetical protein